MSSTSSSGRVWTSGVDLIGYGLHHEEFVGDEIATRLRDDKVVADGAGRRLPLNERRGQAQSGNTDDLEFYGLVSTSCC